MARNSIKLGSGVGKEKNPSLGPFHDSNGNIYIIEPLTASIDVRKLVTGTFTAQDTSNNPTTVNANHVYVSGIQSGTELYIMSITTAYSSGMDNVFDVEYHRYSMSDATTGADTWHTTNDNFYTSGDTTLGDSSKIGDIGIRSDGDIIVTHPGPYYTTMGTDYDKAGYSRLEGSTWTTGTILTGATNTEKYYKPRGIMGTNDTYHCIFVRWVASPFLVHIAGVSVDSANSLSTMATAYSSLNTTFVSVDLSTPVHWNTSGTDRIGVSYNGHAGTLSSIGFVKFKEDASDDLANDTAAQLVQASCNYETQLAWDVDNDDLYVLYSDSATSDLWYESSTNDGVTWGSATEHQDAETIQAITGAEIYDDGSNWVLHFTYLGVSNYWWYDSVNLRSSSAGTTNYQTVAATSTLTAAVTKVKTAPRTIAATSTMTAAVTKAATIYKTIAASSTVTAAIAKVKTAYRTVAASSTMTAALSYGKLFSKAIDATTTVTAALVKAATFPRTIAASSTVTAALTKAAVFPRTLAVSMTATPAVQRTIGLIKAVTSTMTPVLTKGKLFSRAIAATSTMTAAVTKVTTFARTLAVSSTMTPVLARAATLYKTLAVAVTATPDIVRGFYKTLEVAVTATPGVIKKVSKTLAVSVTNAVVVTPVQLILKALDVTSTMTPSIVKTVGKTIAATTTATPAIVKKVSKTLAVNVTMTVGMVRGFFKTLAVTSANAVTLAAVQLILKAIDATSTMTAAVSKALTLSRNIDATSVMTPALSRSVTFLQTVALSSTMTAAVQKTVGKTVAATMTADVAIVRKFFKTFAVTTTVTPAVITAYVAIRAIDATATLVAALIDTFIPAGPPPSWSFAKWLGSPGRTSWSGKDD